MIPILTIPETFLLVSLVLQGFSLLMRRESKSAAFIHIIFGTSLFLCAISMAIKSTHTEPVLFLNMITDHSLFRLPRAAIFIACIMIGRIVANTKELPEGRKPEVLFLLTAVAIFASLLLQSQHLILSYILLCLLSWTGIFLGGLAYRGRLEGEAILKYWMQSSIGVVIGFGALVGLSLVAGSVKYEAIKAFVATTEAFSGPRIFVIFALYLPFLYAAGLFPMHLMSADRDQGVPWSVQAILTVVFQGAITLGLWKLGMEVFGNKSGADVSDGIRILQMSGFAGGFWLILFALGQKNSKRLLTALIGASWSMIIAAGASSGTLGLASIVYIFSATFLWSSLLCFIWSRVHESAHSDELSSIFGVGRTFRLSGLILMMALASPLCLPGFPGFPSALHLFAVVIEQKSLLLLVLAFLLVSLICYVVAQVIVDVLLRNRSEQIANTDNHHDLMHYSTADISTIMLVVTTMLLGGFFWHRIFEVLFESAKAFLN